MTFSTDLPWLHAPGEQALHALETGHMPAGVLIAGQPGLGRRQLAEAISRALLCLDPRAGAAACGVCHACRQMDSGAHPDYLPVEPEEGKAAILVDQIRELSRALSLTASAKGVRCALISPADTLTEAAQNALLKTLEEPPEGVTIILVADSASHLLPTVASRCLRLPVPSPDTEQALAWLNARQERPDWPLLLALCGGAPLAAERLADEVGDSLLPAVNAVVAAAARRSDPIRVAKDFSSWPLPRFAVFIGWLAWAVLRANMYAGHCGQVMPSLEAVRGLGRHANDRRLFRVWDEACSVANDAVVRNDELARERLVLLFVNAFDFTHKPGGKP